MRWFMGIMSVALLTAGFCVPAFAGGTKPLIKGSDAETCGDYGTNVHFEKSPKDAAKRALKEEKLVMVLHISGLFENSDFT